jgi:hypothetical protein
MGTLATGLRTRHYDELCALVTSLLVESIYTE